METIWEGTNELKLDKTIDPKVLQAIEITKKESEERITSGIVVMDWLAIENEKNRWKRKKNGKHTFMWNI
jgi:hypothetical protein